MTDRRDEEALEYHRQPPPGKLAVVATKPLATQRDLSLAYSPGVAAACLEIVKRPVAAAELTVARQSRGRGDQRHRGAGPRRDRPARGQARDGGQGRPLQDLRRHRCLRHRDRRDRPQEARRDRSRPRAHLRRHQSRGHQGAGMLRDRGAPQGAHAHPGVSRRPAWHGHHRRPPRSGTASCSPASGSRMCGSPSAAPVRRPSPASICWWRWAPKRKRSSSPTSRAWSMPAAPCSWTRTRRATPGRPRRARWPRLSAAPTSSSASRRPTC